jgi:manganese transport protein
MDPGQLGDLARRRREVRLHAAGVALVSNIMAIVLQSLCARLAIGSGRDLAQACRDAFPARIAYPLWLWPKSRSSPPTSPR